ncbi:RNA-binding protein FUS-like [Oppia nitens]|uniref:RNA-binding protein FUS-like n=1 Tax=Oppia nitens TaxID=1686743 RepID=UPI0023DB5DD3|nr:RNA-binding protein FUS-like [Oppia nitens]
MTQWDIIYGIILLELPSIALIIIFGTFVVQCNVIGDVKGGGSSSGSTDETPIAPKAKKIQIVYIKVPLSKVLETPSDSYSNGERGFNDGNPSAIPGEGRVPNYANNNGEGGYGGFNSADNGGYDGSNQNGFESFRPSGGQEVYGQQNYANQEQQQSFQNYGNNVQNFNPNDGNMGMAYGAAVGNALPQNHTGNYGQESQNSGYTQPNNQINYDQNNGYGQQPPVYNKRPPNSYDGYSGENFDKNKLRKGFPKMIANFRPQIPIMSTLPAFTMKGFNPSFGSSFPSFGGQMFPTMGGMTGVQGITGLSGISGIGGITESIKGLGGIKNKISMLFGNKFGMGGNGGLLGGVMGWD